jgi:IclR family pca regulon transcriptional regulator
VSPRVRSRHVSSSDEAAWSVPSLSTPRYSQSLERGLAILRMFMPARPVLGIADIADGLGVSRSTTHRYVVTLVALGYLEQDVSSKYRLGLRVTDLGMSALNSTGLRKHAHPYLEELRQRTSYTTSLGVLNGPDLVYVDRLSGFRRRRDGIELELRMGSRLPAYYTAMGKLLLSAMPRGPVWGEVIDQMKLTKRGPNTIKSKRALSEELRRIPAVGYAISDQEPAAELLMVAAPVRNRAGEICAAVDLEAHSSMISLEELVGALGPHLLTTADHISARLGYRRDDEIPGRR